MKKELREKIKKMSEGAKLGLRAFEAYPDRVAARRVAGLPVWDDVKDEFEQEVAPTPPPQPTLGAVKTVEEEELFA